MKKRLLFNLSMLVTSLFFSITKPLYPEMTSANTTTVDYTPKLTDVFNFYGMSNDTEVEGVISRADAAYTVQIPQDHIELTSTFFLQSANSIANGGDVTLVKDTDYQVSYLNNTNVGTATITITFKGNYAGMVTKTFTIIAAAVKPTSGCFGSVSSSLAIGAVLIGLGGLFAVKRKKSII